MNIIVCYDNFLFAEDGDQFPSTRTSAADEHVQQIACGQKTRAAFTRALSCKKHQRRVKGLQGGVLNTRPV